MTGNPLALIGIEPLTNGVTLIVCSLRLASAAALSAIALASAAALSAIALASAAALSAIA